MIRTCKTTAWLCCAVFVFTACKKDDKHPVPKNPDTAPEVFVDRFSPAAGHLMIRNENNGLPAANAPVDFDMGPFITRGLGPGGQVVDYYNFDEQLLMPAPIYVLFRKGAASAVDGQLNIINALPGETGYNDFWQVYKVTVPAGYVANTVTSFAGIQQEGYAMEATTTLVNCPVVPKGSTATKRLAAESSALNRGWYKDSIVYYFTFSEKPLMTTAGGNVPVSPIYVTFNINPGLPDGGPSSGFKMETGSAQTHNVIATVPTDGGYSPLWSVSVYDNNSFNNVSSLPTAQAAPILATGVANVNCPVVAFP